jgi:hypothetical protein
MRKQLEVMSCQQTSNLKPFRKLPNNLLSQLTGLDLFQGLCHDWIIFRSMFTQLKKTILNKAEFQII